MGEIKRPLQLIGCPPQLAGHPRERRGDAVIFDVRVVDHDGSYTLVVLVENPIPRFQTDHGKAEVCPAASAFVRRSTRLFRFCLVRHFLSRRSHPMESPFRTGNMRNRFQNLIGVFRGHLKELSCPSLPVEGFDRTQIRVQLIQQTVQSPVRQAAVHFIRSVGPKGVRERRGTVELTKSFLQIVRITDFYVLRETRIGKDVDDACHEDLLAMNRHGGPPGPHPSCRGRIRGRRSYFSRIDADCGSSPRPSSST